MCNSCISALFLQTHLHQSQFQTLGQCSLDSQRCILCCPDADFASRVSVGLLSLNCTDLIWPISAYWNLMSDSSNCISESTYTLAAGIVTLLIDTAVLALPIKIICTLKISWQKQLQVAIIFGSAMLVLAAGVVRVHEVHVLTTSGDFTWNLYTIWTWATVELGIGIICGSLPACSVLLKAWVRPSTARQANYSLKPYIEKSDSGKTSVETENIRSHA